MRIGLVVPGFSADASDWCIPALRHLARALAVSDDVRVIAIRYPYRRGRYVVDGADVIAIGGAERRGAAALELWRTSLQTLRREHHWRPFDVLHAFWATESGLLAALAGRLLRVPTLVSLAGGELVALPEINYGDQRVSWERLKVRASLRLASAVSAGSRLLRELAQRHVSTARLHLSPLGVDLDLFNPGAPVLSNAAHLVHVGTLTGVKDQMTLLRAFRGVRRRFGAATLDVVGDGPLRPDLERLACELGIAQAVRFCGSVDHAELPAVYRSGGAFVLSSRHEAQGMVALEAAACGIPVVGTRVGILPELTDLVAPVAAPDLVADAIIASLDHPEQAAPMARVRKQFGLAPCADRFRGLYAALLSG